MLRRQEAVLTRHTITSREFNRDTGRAKRAASAGPVFITDRGKPAHVLLTFEEYRKLSASTGSMVDQLSMPADDAIEFEPLPWRARGFQAADFS